MPVLVFVFFPLPSQEVKSALFFLSLASPSNDSLSAVKLVISWPVNLYNRQSTAKTSETLSSKSYHPFCDGSLCNIRIYKAAPQISF